jgi:hypothetical protein
MVDGRVLAPVVSVGCTLREENVTKIISRDV